MDKDNRYGAVSRLNHWLGAVAVFAMLLVGLYSACSSASPGG